MVPLLGIFIIDVALENEPVVWDSGPVLAGSTLTVWYTATGPAA